MSYSPKFFQNLGYAQQRLRKHGELFSVQLLEECINEIQRERRSTLAPSEEKPLGRDPVGGCDCGVWMDVADGAVLGDDSNPGS